jgi:hypothetical protein
MPSSIFTDLGNRSGEIVEAAFRGPVEITAAENSKSFC